MSQIHVDVRSRPEEDREATDPFTRGNFAPVSGEQTIAPLKVRGSLPRELCGRLMRNGPNPVRPVDHWFVGDAMLHGIEIADGKARSYRNRWIRTPNVEQHKGLPAASSGVQSLAVQASGAVHVIAHAGRILALPEVGLPWELTPELQTRGLYDFRGRLSSNMTAHPKIDAKTGELVFFGYDFGDVHLRYHVADAQGELVHSVEIDTPRPTMMHDFGVTATRVVFMDFPVVFDLDMVARGRSLPFRWRDDVGARLGVMPRRGSSDDVVWIEIEPCYVFHPLNAYDDGERIVLDVVRHRDTFVDGGLGAESERPRLERWTIDPRARTVDMQVIDERAQEFPRVDPRVECHRHRYGYAVAVQQDSQHGAIAFGDLLKHDLSTGKTQIHAVGPAGAASEGVFVPVGSGEDEGYVLAPVYDAETHTSHVRVIDAQNFSADPVAAIELPVRIPFGFHGNFIGL